MRYHSIPTEVDAEQWFPGKDVRGVQAKPFVRMIDGGHDCCYFVVTIHGCAVPLDPGDYVVADPDGIHHYPVKPAVFEKEYRPAKAADEIEAALAKCREWALTDEEVEELLK